MKIKLILILIFGMFLISFISASSDLELSLSPHYFYQSKPTIIYNNETKFDGIFFDVIGTNHNSKSRILNLTIVDAYPLVFKNSLQDIKENLRILQAKTLFISQIIDINQFNQTSINFWVGIEGTLEKTGEILYTEAHLNIILPTKPKEEKSIFFKIGDAIWEDNDIMGFLIFILVIFFIGFFIWKFKISKRLGGWRDRKEVERYDRRLEKDGEY